MERSLETWLDRIISQRSVTVLFQPIVCDRKRRVFAFEALLRGPSDSPLHAPESLFDTAQRNGRLVELELLAREVAIEQFSRQRLPGKLFLNTSPQIISQADFRPGCTREMLERVGLDPKRLVIELTEQYPLESYEAVREAMHHYHAMGFEIAIDDLGAGYAGLRMWSELRPDYVKIDRHFIQGIHGDRVKQEFVRSIHDIAKGLSCRVVAEGVETREEYGTVVSLGIDLCQGYYFSRPKPRPPTSLNNRLFARTAVTGRHKGDLSRSIKDLVQPLPAVDASTRVEETLQRFQREPHLASLPVVAGNHPLGLVRRHELTALLLTGYGRELHGHKPIHHFLDPGSLIFESELPLEEASHLLSSHDQPQQALDFIVTDTNGYCGVGSVFDLLKLITELQVRNARYANPLTLLPGNVPIYEELDRLLADGGTFHVSYCDLDNFKPFNDSYGYEKGDVVIRQLAQILNEEVDEHCDFVGHIGGDDFILIMQSGDWQQRIEKILHRFEEAAVGHYSEEDRANGGIWALNRAGEQCFFPLLSLSIGTVNPDPLFCRSHHDVAALASEAKHQAKRLEGNSLFVDRRRRPALTPTQSGAVA